MRRHKPKFMTASALFLWILSFTLHAETPLQDPQIPDGESLLYRITKEEKKTETTSYLEQLTVREQDNEEEVYRIFSVTPERDTETLLRRRDLLPIQRNETIRLGGSTIVRQAILEELSPPGKNSLFVLDMADLMQQLRGYPFSSPETLQLIMAGQNPQEDSFSMAIAYGGTEIIEAGGRSFSTHRLSLNIKMSGPMSIIARLIPKTQFWYSSSPPHYLVRFEGGSGFGSSGKQVVELIDYSRK
jgi:hypothetical protein